MRARYLELEDHTHQLHSEAEQLCRQARALSLHAIWGLLGQADADAHKAQPLRSPRAPTHQHFVMHAAACGAILVSRQAGAHAAQLQAHTLVLLCAQGGAPAPSVLPVQVMTLKQQVRELEAQKARPPPPRFVQGPHGPPAGSGGGPRYDSRGPPPGRFNSPPGQNAGPRGYDSRHDSRSEGRKRSPPPDLRDERYSRRSR